MHGPDDGADRMRREAARKRSPMGGDHQWWVNRLARLVRIFLPRRRVLRNPLGRVVLRNKTLDNFRFAIGP